MNQCVLFTPAVLSFVLLLIGATVIHAQTNRVLLDNFFNRTSISPWTFYNGAEFPGATGSLGLISDGYKGGQAARLSYNLTSGNYVSATLPIASAKRFTFTIITFMVRQACAENNKISLRIADSTGQTFQFSNSASRPFESISEDWYPVMFYLSGNKSSNYWGGAADGVIHQPIASVTILTDLLSKSRDLVGCLDFDDVYVSNSSQVDLDMSNFVNAPIGGEMLSRMGVNVHFTSDDKGLDAVKAGGFSWVRMDLFWSAVETKKGVYNFKNYDALIASLNQRGLKALLILTYSNNLYSDGPPINSTSIQAFANYSRAAAQHFAGNGSIFEVYNEANIQGFTAEQYASLVNAAIAAVHEGDPTALVSTTGLAGFDFTFLDSYLAAGGGKNADGIGLHPYGLGISGSPVGKITDYMRRFRSDVTYYFNNTENGFKIPIVWDTEWGLTSTDFDPTGKSNGLDATALRTQANRAVQRLLGSCAVGFPIYIYYDLRNDGVDPTNREHNFGLLFNNYTDKPSMTAVKQMSNMVKGKKFDAFLQTRGYPVVAMRFTGDNETVVVVWPTDYASTTIVSVQNATSVVDIFNNTISLNNGAFSISDTDGVVYVTYKKASSVIPVYSSPIPIKSPAVNASGKNGTVATSNSSQSYLTLVCLFIMPLICLLNL